MIFFGLVRKMLSQSSYGHGHYKVVTILCLRYVVHCPLVSLCRLRREWLRLSPACMLGKGQTLVS